MCLKRFKGNGDPMKRLRLFICIFLSCFILSRTTAYAYYDPLTSRQYDDLMDPLHFEKGLTNFDNISGYMSTYVVKNTPKDVWDLFFQEGVNIYITQSVPRSERSDYGGAFDGVCYSATLTWNSSKKITKVSVPVSIYIYHDASRADSYIHECGHALDYIAEYITGYYKGSMPISNSSEWSNLYNNYGIVMASFDRSAAVNVPRDKNEGFAEAYRLYFSYPQQLQSQCPEVYNFVASQIAKYTAYVPPLSYDNFDPYSYSLAYPDLYNAYGYDKKALWNHYVNYGKAEGRIANREVKVKR